MSKLDLICLDADDTLWHNLIHFARAEHEFGVLFSDYLPEAAATRHLMERERHNIGLYGFGVKSFTLSMIESAIEISKGAVDVAVITRLMAIGREMLTHEIELLPHVVETLAQLSQTHRLILATKGDLYHQERKVKASGIAHYFHGIEIVSDKKPYTFVQIAQRYGADVRKCLMAGNSVRSDVLPIIEAGGYGCYVPFEITWDHEHEEVPADLVRYYAVDDLSGLADVVRRIESQLG